MRLNQSASEIITISNNFRLSGQQIELTNLHASNITKCYLQRENVYYKINFVDNERMFSRYYRTHFIKIIVKRKNINSYIIPASTLF